jgi:hypothetical protein
MGEKQNEPFQLSFKASLNVDFQGSRVTSDGGLILVRELDERLGLGGLIAEHLDDARRGKNTQLLWRGERCAWRGEHVSDPQVQIGMSKQDQNSAEFNAIFQ